MNSRKMERAADPGEGRQESHEIARTLSSLRLPARLLAVDWAPSSEIAARAEEIVSHNGVDIPDGETFQGVLWQTPAPPDTAQLRKVRDRLRENGRLLVRGVPKEGQSSEEIARLLVRALSEEGFAILKEPAPEALGFSAGAVVLARRDEFRIRAFEDGDGEAIRRLFVASFHLERGAAHWRWKYHTSPYGNRYISLAFSPDGELAAHYAGYPVPFWCDGRTFLGLQMSDTMTSGRFRHVGRGISSLLARTVRHFFAIYRHGPIGFFYGFNTGGIERFCRWFIGGSQVEPVSYRVRDHERPLPDPRKGYRVERVHQLDPRWTRFFRRVAPSYGFLVRRDAEYLDWRYLRCPDGEPYVLLAAFRWRRLVGWSVFRRKEEGLVWGDALFDPRHRAAAGAILKRALKTPELTGTSRTEAWFAKRPTWWDEELRKLGFENRPEPERLVFIHLPDRESPPHDRIYYTKGDGDLF